MIATTLFEKGDTEQSKCSSWATVSPLLDELQARLDQEMELLEGRLAQLDSLRGLILNRDDAGMVLPKKRSHDRAGNTCPHERKVRPSRETPRTDRADAASAGITGVEDHRPAKFAVGGDGPADISCDADDAHRGDGFLSKTFLKERVCGDGCFEGTRHGRPDCQALRRARDERGLVCLCTQRGPNARREAPPDCHARRTDSAQALGDDAASPRGRTDQSSPSRNSDRTRATTSPPTRPTAEFLTKRNGAAGRAWWTQEDDEEFIDYSARF